MTASDSSRSPDLRRAVEVALKESKRWEKLEDDLRRALESGDEALALDLARILVGLAPHGEPRDYLDEATLQYWKDRVAEASAKSAGRHTKTDRRQ